MATSAFLDQELDPLAPKTAEILVRQGDVIDCELKFSADKRLVKPGEL